MVAAVVASACGDAVAPEPAPLQRLAIDPPAGVARRVGDSVAFRAEGVRADGSTEPIAVAWSSDDTTIARIDDRGVAVGIGPGVTLVRARGDSVSGIATMAVDPDTVPPTLVSLGADRDRVNVGLGPQLVKVRAVLRDDRSGVRQVLAVFDGPLGAGISSLVVFGRVDDPDPENFVFEGFVEVPAVISVGTWTLSVLRAKDAFGNLAQWGARALQARGLGVRFEAVIAGG